ncbi:RDD family protein [Polycladidibacter hongkongensis]|uniref:RDD family protein n=1 Tax=Polycladidibacter hongkongensis TaxID=1647556 RepID=UPI0008358110|nr:RDD family protein [Pseudovibrio hongkongensis]
MHSEFSAFRSAEFYNKFSDDQISSLIENTRRRRFFALIIDLAIFALGVFVLSFLGTDIHNIAYQNYELHTVIYLITSNPLNLLFFLLPFIYYGYTLGSKEQATPGMQAVGLKAFRNDGKPINFSYAISFMVFSASIFSIGTIFFPLLLCPLISNYKRTLHDVILGTAVVNSSAYGDFEEDKLGKQNA